MRHFEISDKSIKYCSLLILIAQCASHSLLLRIATMENRLKFLKAVTVLFTELIKLAVSSVIVIYQQKSLFLSLDVIRIASIEIRKDWMKMVIIAFGFTMQNYLVFIAAQNLPAITFMITGQLKILITAALVVIILKRSQSLQQWISLVVLTVGIVIVQFEAYHKNDGGKYIATVLADNLTSVKAEIFNSTLEEDIAAIYNFFPSQMNSIQGLLAVLIGSLMTCTAGIWLEKIIKSSKSNIWIRNIQLSFISVLLAVILAFIEDSDVISQDGYAPQDILKNMLYGFDYIVWLTVASSAFGGILIAVVLKYADSMMKALATSFAILVNFGICHFVFNFEPTWTFIIGAVLVVMAVLVYSAYSTLTIEEDEQVLCENEEETAKSDK